MTHDEMNESREIANRLENEVAELHIKLTYPQIVKLALISAKNMLKVIPMYTGNSNPEWATYNFTVELLQGRLNGG